MHPIARGWRRFRRLPGVLQAVTGLVLVAAYSLVLVLLFAGGGDDDERTVGVPDRPKARPLTAAERNISRMLESVGTQSPADGTDVQRFRRPYVKAVSCQGEKCETIEVTYSVGLPGRGRILVDQRRMWEQLFRKTGVVKGTMHVTRDATAAGVPAKAGEETPTGAPLLTTRCDRSKYPNVDWASAKGAQILVTICKIQAYDQGQVHRQEPVAPDDETAGEVGVPSER